MIDRAAAGEEVVIARAGKPVARLVPLTLPVRTPGLLGSTLNIPDDFDSTLPDDVLALFDGG